VGNEIGEQSGTLKKVFDCVSNINVRMVSFGGSIHNISMLVDSSNKKQVLQQLNSGLFGLN
jgi:aspartate kinase